MSRLSVRARSTMAGCLLAATASLASPPASASDLWRTQRGTEWRWGAHIDESTFQSSGNGVTLYVDGSRASDGDGSAANPFSSIGPAVKRASELMRSMETQYSAAPFGTSLPVWLRIVRHGDVIETSVAEDKAGAAGEWHAVGSQKFMHLPRHVYTGLLVASGTAWPDTGSAAEATFDRAILNGDVIPSTRWIPMQLGVDRGATNANTSEKGLTLRGNGVYSHSSSNWHDNGQLAYLPVDGDCTISVRLRNLGAAPQTKAALATLTLREKLTPGARMVSLEILSHDGFNAPFEIWQGWRDNLSTPGRDVRISIGPGVYRLTSPIEIPDRDEAARNRVLAIEGQEQGGGKGRVVVSGSQVEGWQAPTWLRQADGSYTHSWTNKWGGTRIDDRHELIFVTPPGGTPVRLTQVMLSDWKAAPDTFTVDEAAQALRIALPAGMNQASFASATLEVATFNDWLLLSGVYCAEAGPGDNLLLKNLVFEHCAGNVALQLNDWCEPNVADRNIKLEDVVVRDNARMGAVLDHIRDFTLERVNLTGNGCGNWSILAEGQIIDCKVEHNGWRAPSDALWAAWKNVYCSGTSFSFNNGTSFRNDHVAENDLLDRCQFNGNTNGQAIEFETAIGPIVIRDSQVRDNTPAADPASDSAVILSTVSNFTLDHVLFKNNKRACLSFYPRERAHTAVSPGGDELCNNLDLRRWETGNTAEDRWGPDGKKPAAYNNNFIIHDCTFDAGGADDRFIVQYYYQRPDAYVRNISQDLRAWNNTYVSPSNAKPFETGNRIYGGLDEWKAQSKQANFEAGSKWNEVTSTAFTPPTPHLAARGHKPGGQKLGGGRIRYEVENLPFQSTRDVELVSNGGASGGKAEKLLVDQVGDLGDNISYTLTVASAGNYYVNVGYLQSSGAFEYLGDAQLSIDGIGVDPFWDESGVKNCAMDVPLGRVHLSKGEHTFTFTAVWRNGYVSGDYDIDVDYIDLSTTLSPLPAVKAVTTTAGLSYRLYHGSWSTLPNLQSITPVKDGTVAQPNLSVADTDQFAITFDGDVTVPSTSTYTFATTVNDGANLYIDGRLIVDNDGVHDGEKNEPWRKSGRVALAAGKHHIRLDYFNSGGTGKYLDVLMGASDMPLRSIDKSAFSH